MRSLQLSHRHLPGQVTVIAVVGEVDQRSHARLRSYLDDARRCPGEQLVFDLTDMLGIDSGGIHVLGDAHRNALDHGTTTRMAGPSLQVIQALKVSRLAACIPVYLTLAEALRAVLADRPVTSGSAHHSARRSGLDSPS
ncbi:STAS domain-containing protein [Spirillospora sp. CA-142024]|uniref:STAS domain-containing protein n=1 Tax=Spirillospora sp. CA-142024 TaxID=3240036 RepID=UPI003D91C8C5